MGDFGLHSDGATLQREPRTQEIPAARITSHQSAKHSDEAASTRTCRPARAGDGDFQQRESGFRSDYNGQSGNHGSKRAVGREQQLAFVARVAIVGRVSSRDDTRDAGVKGDARRGGVSMD